MATFNRTELKAFFETGDFPTEGEFGDWFDSIPLWTKTTKIFSDFQPNPGSITAITLFTGAAGSTPLAVKIKHSASFTGGTISAATVQIAEPSGLPISAAFDVFQAPGNFTGQIRANISLNIILDQVSTSNYLIILVLTGDVINALVAGSVDVWVLEGPVT